MLYSHEMVNLLQQLRSRVMAEFGIRIRLADPSLLESLRDIGLATRDSVTRQAIGEVLRLADLCAPGSSEAATAAKVNYYRGQPLPGDDSEPVVDKPPLRQSGAKRIYRGQIVSG